MEKTEPNTPRAAALAGSLRELSGFEEELVLRGGSNPVRVANEALARCLAKPGADAAERRAQVCAMPVIERDRLLLELRRLSVGDEVRGEVKCPDCGRTSEAVFRLSRLPLNADQAEGVEVELPGGGTVSLRPVTAGDQERLLERGEGGVDAVLVMTSAWSAAQIAALDDEDRQRIEEGFARANPDLDIRLRLACHACVREMDAPFDIEGFFFDELSAHARTLLDDVHALARAYHWTEEAILGLSWRRRLAYLGRIEAQQDTQLAAGAARR